MKRRRFFQTLAAAPAVPALLGQRAPDETPKLETSVPDIAADSIPRFFNPSQFAALQKLGDIVMPPINGAPGARDAGAPEFLDFIRALASAPN